MQELLVGYVSAIEKDLSVKTADKIYELLRKCGLLAFGEIMFDIQSDQFKRIKQFLPHMASEQVQRDWTGNSGTPLLMQSLDFVRSVTTSYCALTGRDISGAKVLDFGCGYGRIARLMYFFTDPVRIIGVDPWDRSIEICRDCGLGDNFRQSEYLPDMLPCEVTFDFIYAFSVFTHLSEKVTLKCLSTLRKYISPNGLLCITIRPIEYWQHHQPQDERIAGLVRTHRRVGFAFQPHVRDPIDGEIPYGDTSITPEWLAENSPEWRMLGLDASYLDEGQLYLYLAPA